MNFKDRMNGKSPVKGIFCKTTDSAFIEATGFAGLDFVILDQEHGSLSLETIHHHVRAAQLGGTLPIVRVKDIEPHAIASALDAGAGGVQVPNINTAEQARTAVQAAKFHPLGKRGVCRFVRAAEYGSKDRADYFQQSNSKLLILQVEGVDGVKNLDDILNVPGFDILFIGPYDLSQSVGKPGEIDSPEVITLIRQIAEKAKCKGIFLGAFCDTDDGEALLRSEGFHYIAKSVDVNVYYSALKDLFLK